METKNSIKSKIEDLHQMYENLKNSVLQMCDDLDVEKNLIEKEKIKMAIEETEKDMVELERIFVSSNNS